jgi:hypothetical protein
MSGSPPPALATPAAAVVGGSLYTYRCVCAGVGGGVRLRRGVECVMSAS